MSDHEGHELTNNKLDLSHRSNVYHMKTLT